MSMRLALVVAATLAGTQAVGGAWPRGEGHGFLSLKYTGRYDLEDVALLDFTREDLFQGYGEIGVAPRLTFGGEYSRSGPGEAPVSEVRGFVRFTFLQRGPHVMSAEIGAGQRGNDFGYEVGFVRPGLAWGRGFDSSIFGEGWVELDAQTEIYDTEDDPAIKLDATLGINITDRFAVILQGRAGDYPNLDPYFRIAPSAVVRLTQRLRVQAEFEAGVYNDTGVAGAVAVWLDF
jgi:hypothetical protein